MNVRRQQFLARAGFPDQQHARIRSRGQRCLFHRPQKRRRCSDHFLTRTRQLAQPGVFFPQLGLLERVLEGYQHALAAERLLQKIERAGADGFHGVGDGPVAGNHDGRRVFAVLAEPAHQLDAAAVGQLHVQQVSVGAPGVGMSAEFGERAAQGNRVAFALQNHAQRAADIVFVVDDEDFFIGHSCQPAESGGTQRRPTRREQAASRRRRPVRSCERSTGPGRCRPS